MNDEVDELYWELNFDLKSEIESMRDPKGFAKLVHYTTAANAINVIRGREFWLRNCRLMNDYREIEHGIDLIEELLEPGRDMRVVLETLDQHHPGILEAVVKRFHDTRVSLENETFVGCLSAHLESESNLGRLSMWRAYGGDAGAALVLRPEALLRDETDLNIYAGPVKYGGIEILEGRVQAAIARGLLLPERLAAFNFDYLLDQLTSVLASWALLLKHPGFKEEAEWRIFANERVFGSSRAKHATEVIGGLPQEVLKVPLTPSDEVDTTDLSLSNALDRIIIGPCRTPEIVAAALRRELLTIGISDEDRRIIRLSRIPLRTSI